MYGAAFVQVGIEADGLCQQWKQFLLGILQNDSDLALTRYISFQFQCDLDLKLCIQIASIASTLKE